MKLIHVEAIHKDSEEHKLPNELNLDFLPKEILLAYSIQYKHTAEELKKKLESKKIKVKGPTQVLGCTNLKSSIPILLVGSGKFHALNLGLRNNIPVYIYNSGKITELDKKELEMLKARKTAALSKFLYAEKIGIIVSTKPGQENLKQAEGLKKLITKKYPEKTISLFLSNNINLSEFENFPVDFWINTACPGLFYDTSKIINSDDILAFLN
jgi:2-(3-amino-3-carboxypropyl)histidine synthase